MFTASEVFELAIQVEINGERYYRHALSKVKSESLKDMLVWLADQEIRHHEVFEEIRERAARQAVSMLLPSEQEDELSGMVLRDAMGRHAFSLDELHVDKIVDERELLQAAIEFEDDSIQFFEFIGSLLSDTSALIVIQEIRAEELEHKRLLVEKLSEIGA